MVVPAAAVYLVLRLIFGFLDQLLQPLLTRTGVKDIPGLGIALLVVVIYFSGLVARFVIGRRLIALAEQVINRVPFIGFIYKSARQATELFASPDGRKFNRVVLIDFPRKGTKSFGLVTARMIDENNQPILAVYVPTTPTPYSGFLILVPEDEVITVDMSVDEVMRIIISGGILSPERISRAETQSGTLNGSSSARTQQKEFKE